MKIKDFVDKFKGIMEELVDDISSPKSMEKLGEAASELIRKRTRLGYGVEDHNGSKTKLNPLGEPYKKSRKRNKPSGPTTPARSNLTNSGDMLDDLGPVKSSEGNVEVGFKSELSSKKAEWVTEGGRPFNNLSKSEVKQIEQALAEEVGKRIKETLRKLK